jgi:hypothetical protein
MTDDEVRIAKQAVRLTPSKYNTAVPADWRWERARLLRENKMRASKRKEDPWVMMALRFQRELANADSRVAFERLEHKYPTIYWSWYWHSDMNAHNRWTIEAYLCSGLAMVEIADRHNLPVDLINCYAHLFFDVVGKTRHIEYMLNSVLGRNIHHGLLDKDVDLLWKLYGLLKGPLLLEKLIRQTSDLTAVTTETGIQAAMTQLIRDAIGIRTLYAAKTIPISYNQEVIFALHTKLSEIEKADGNAPEASSVLLGAAKEIIGSFSFFFNDEDNRVGEATGIEPRAHDMIQSTFGPRPMIGLNGNGESKPVIVVNGTQNGASKNGANGINGSGHCQGSSDYGRTSSFSSFDRR